jgi:DNA-binding NarL/FixJ family response regulator
VENVRVLVEAADPLSLAGLMSYLGGREDVTVVRAEQAAEADVVLVAADRLTRDVISTLRRVAAHAATPAVLIVAEISKAELLLAVECRVVAVLPRAAVTRDRLLYSVKAASAGGGVMPPELVGELLRHLERLQREVLLPHGLTASGFTSREIDVLGLLAQGLDTAEIAGKLCYSERTVKNILYGATNRMHLRSRAHAVAHALRVGAI